MVQGCQSLAKVLVCLLCEVHPVEGTHQDAIELDGFRVQRRGHVFETLNSLLLCNLKLAIIKSNLTYVSYGGYIVIFASNPLIKELFHKALHFAALECVLDPALVPILSVLVGKHLVGEVPEPICFGLPDHLDPVICAIVRPKRRLALPKLLEVVIVLHLLLLGLLLSVLEPVLSLGGVREFKGGLLRHFVDLDAEVGGEGEEERVQVAGRPHQVIQGVPVVLARIGQKHGRPEVLGLGTRPENQVHVVHHCHLDLVVHVLGEETGLLQQFTLLHLVLLLSLLVQLVLTSDSVRLGVVKIGITGIVVSIIPLFLELLSFLFILLKPALVLDYHPGHLLIEYVLAGPREHLRNAQVSHMRHHRQRRHHP